MLEILLVIGLCKHVGSIVRNKGHRAGWYQFFVVVAWFGGEFGGGFAAAILMVVLNPDVEPPLGVAYLAAIVCAAVCVGVVYYLAKSLPDRRTEIQAASQVFAPVSGQQPRETGNPYQPPMQ